MLFAAGLLGWMCSPAAAAIRIDGQVQAGGAVAMASCARGAACSGALVHAHRVRVSVHRAPVRRTTRRAVGGLTPILAPGTGDLTGSGCIYYVDAIGQIITRCP